MYTVSYYCFQNTESGSDVKAGDKMTLLNAKPGSSSLEVTVSFSMFTFYVFMFCMFPCLLSVLWRWSFVISLISL